MELGETSSSAPIRKSSLRSTKASSQSIFARMRASARGLIRRSFDFLSSLWIRIRGMFSRSSSEKLHQVEKRIKINRLSQLSQEIVEGQVRGDLVSGSRLSGVRKALNFLPLSFRNPVVISLACGIFVSALALGLGAAFSTPILYIASVFLALHIIAFVILQSFASMTKRSTGKSIDHLLKETSKIIESAKKTSNNAESIVESANSVINVGVDAAKIVVNGAAMARDNFVGALKTCVTATVATCSRFLVGENNTDEANEQMPTGLESDSAITEESIIVSSNDESSGIGATILELPAAIASSIWVGASGLISMGMNFISSNDGSKVLKEIVSTRDKSLSVIEEGEEEEEFFDAVKEQSYVVNSSGLLKVQTSTDQDVKSTGTVTSTSPVDEEEDDEEFFDAVEDQSYVVNSSGLLKVQTSTDQDVKSTGTVTSTSPVDEEEDDEEFFDAVEEQPYVVNSSGLLKVQTSTDQDVKSTGTVTSTSPVDEEEDDEEFFDAVEDQSIYSSRSSSPSVSSDDSPSDNDNDIEEMLRSMRLPGMMQVISRTSSALNSLLRSDVDSEDSSS